MGDGVSILMRHSFEGLCSFGVEADGMVVRFEVLIDGGDEIVFHWVRLFLIN